MNTEKLMSKVEDHIFSNKDVLSWNTPWEVIDLLNEDTRTKIVDETREKENTDFMRQAPRKTMVENEELLIENKYIDSILYTLLNPDK